MSTEPQPMVSTGRVVDRYVLHDEIAAGGMATVHLGRLRGAEGFSRTVAIKRLHAQFARDEQFVAMFLDEARLAARIRHPNVVSTLDVVSSGDELFLVMDYVQGETLARALRTVAGRGERMPAPIAAAVVVGALHGLHAAHEAKDERGRPLHVVHRDVSPQNILIGADGIARVLDFGVAKAAGRLHETRDGQIKGKLSYMAPEQFHNQGVTRSVDIYAASVVLWEALTGRRLFAGDSEAAIVERVLYASIEPASSLVADLPPGIDQVLARGLARDPADRFSTARELAAAAERCLGVAPVDEVAAWLDAVAGPALRRRAEMVTAIECPIEQAAPKAAPSPSNALAPFELTGAAVTSPTAFVGAKPLFSPASAPGPRPRRALALATGLSLTLAAAALLSRSSSVPSLAAASPTSASAPGPALTADELPAASSAPASPAVVVSAAPPGSAPGQRPARAGTKPAPPPGAVAAKNRARIPAGLPDSRD